METVKTRRRYNFGAGKTDASRDARRFSRQGAARATERAPGSRPLFALQARPRGPILIAMNTALAFLPNFGGPEMIVIFVIILLLFGAKKIPELARGLGKSMGEFKRAREDFEREITRSEEEVRIKEAAGKEAHDKA